MAKGNKKNDKNISNPVITDFEVQEVYRILKKKNPGKKFSINVNPTNFGDIYAPNGLSELGVTGPVIIAVKRELSYSTIRFTEALFKLGENNVLVVYEYTDIPKTEIPTKKKDGEYIRVYMQLSDLKRGSRLPTNKVETFYNDLQKDWKATRDTIVKEANGIVKDRNNVLVLGAGVGMSAKMPSWTQLLQGIMGEVKLSGDTLEAFRHLNNHVYEQCGDSNLIMARYLETAIKLSKTKESFPTLISKHLYSSDLHTSPLLENLAEIIRSQKVKEVITYNFDDILEQALTRLGLKEGKNFSSIAKEVEVKANDIIPIYHVHGIIPQNGIADTVVFTEDDYHERYKNSYHWSNVEQLHAMSRMHCFFVGLSMEDPNLRRLLDFSTRMNNRDRAEHYAFLHRKKLEEYCIPDVQKHCKYTQISGSLIDKKKQKEIYELNYGVLDQMFRDLGVKVIWFEDYKEELPRLVAQVFGIYTDSHHETSEPTDTNSILNETQEKINRIKEIEDKAAQLNNPTVDFVKFYEIYKYINDNKQEYKNMIDDVYGRINALSDRVKIEIPEDINKMLNNIPQFNGTISGFGQFYSIIFNSLYKLLAEK